MSKNSFEISFNENIATIINTQIQLLNEHTVILKEILNRMNSKKKDTNFRLTDELLIDEIKAWFDEDCITSRTFASIKAGRISSSAFNIFIIIYILNDLSNEVNVKYKEYGEKKDIPLIDIDQLMEPLKG